MKRGALIGCGFFAQNHMNAWRAIDGVEIVAVCDLDRTKAQAMATHFGIDQIYTDVSELLQGVALDFVDVATTAPSHRGIVEQMCGNVDVIVCQKPFAENMADARAMVDAAEASSTTLMIHENFRWQKAFTTMRRLIAEGRIGDPHFSRFSFRHGFDNYTNQPYLAEIERFTIMDVGLHLFDLARSFMGEVTRLSCNAQRVNPIVKGEDVFTALLAHESGTTSVVDCSFFAKIDPEPFPQTAAWIEGDLGTLELTVDFDLKIHNAGKHEILNVEPMVPAWGERPWHNVQDSVLQFQTHVVQVLEGQAEPQPSGRDNLKTLALALAAYDAAALGETIKLDQWEAGTK